MNYHSNIQKCLDNASSQAYKEGLAWYPRIRERAVEISEAYSTDLIKVVGIHASVKLALPKKAFTGAVNALLRGTADPVGANPGVGTKDVNEKINRILNGEDPRVVLNRVPYQSPRIYLDNILEPYANVEPRTTQMPVELAMNKMLDASDFHKIMRTSAMKDIKKAYTEVAKANYIFVPQLQAITWNDWRIRNYPNKKGLVL